MDLLTAKKQQDLLQEEAREVLNLLDLQKLYDPIGSLVEKGSFSYGLMVIPDIDFNVYVKEPLDELEKLNTIAKALLKNELVQKVSIVKSGYIIPPAEGKPKGIWAGVHTIFNKKVWNIDTWILTKDQFEETELGVDMYKITQEQHDAILLLKAALQEKGRYGHKNDYYSADIYRAVCLYNIRTIEELDRNYKN